MNNKRREIHTLDIVEVSISLKLFSVGESLNNMTILEKYPVRSKKIIHFMVA